MWHTQGSGKSLTMVFLVPEEKCESIPTCSSSRSCVVTDRTDLEQQLSKTATLTGETVLRARNSKRLQAMLKEQGPGLVFAMVQKYQERDNGTGDPGDGIDLEVDSFPLLNDSEEILVLVDERTALTPSHFMRHAAAPQMPPESDSLARPF